MFSISDNLEVPPDWLAPVLAQHYNDPSSDDDYDSDAVDDHTFTLGIV